jgi:hypothetical protein
MSTEELTVFTGAPAKDGADHGSDAMGYSSLAYEILRSSGVSEDDVQTHRKLVKKYRRPA